MMDTLKIRNKIIQTLEEVSDNKLEEIYNYISNLEKKTQINMDQLKFAGTWKDIDKDVFENLTDKLIENRAKSKRRFD